MQVGQVAASDYSDLLFALNRTPVAQASSDPTAFDEYLVRSLNPDASYEVRAQEAHSQKVRSYAQATEAPKAAATDGPAPADPAPEESRAAKVSGKGAQAADKPAKPDAGEKQQGAGRGQESEDRQDGSREDSDVDPSAARGAEETAQALAVRKDAEAQGGRHAATKQRIQDREPADVTAAVTGAGPAEPRLAPIPAGDNADPAGSLRKTVEMVIDLSRGERSDAPGAGDGTSRTKAAKISPDGSSMLAAKAAIQANDGRQSAGGDGKASRTHSDPAEGHVNSRKLSVVDLRREAREGQSESDLGHKDRQHQAAVQAAGHESENNTEGAQNPARGPGGDGVGAAEKTFQTASTGVRPSLTPATQTAREALTQHLRDQGNTEIVRSARLIVRNNESGEIRLLLKPESLGTVRIALQLQEGHIAGRIIVDNASVRDVFEQNLGALNRAFQEGGLELGALDVSVADFGEGTGAGEGGDAAPPGSKAAVRSAQEFGNAVPMIEVMDEYHDLVDLVV